MASLYFDEDSQEELCIVLARAAGLSVSSSAECGMNGSADEDQFAFAAAHGHTLVTANADDFRRLQGDWAKRGIGHRGIVIRSQEFSPQETVRCLVAFIQATPEAALESGVFYLANYAGRVT
jgi:hypothetical protein